MQSFTIDKNDWSRGISLTTKHNNGGFSPVRKGINLAVAQGGILYPQPARTNMNSGAVVLDVIAAFAADPTFLGNDAFALDEDGNFYTIDAGVVTKRQTDSVKAYNDGTSDMRVFRGALYATSSTDIALLTGISTLSSIDHDWWTTTEGNSALASTYRHPIEVVEDTMYIADNFNIHTWDGTTSVEDAMSLPSEYNITSMIVHTDGRHLLVFVAETANYSHTQRAKARCFMIDTVNLEFVREIEIDAQIEGCINVGGVIYVTYGGNLGYFNGDGVTFLRKLNTSTTYKHCMANMEGVLVVRDKSGLLAYGDLGLGNVFWYMYADDQTSPERTFNAIFYAGDNTMYTSVSNRLLDVLDFDTFAGASNFDSNFYSFPGKVWIRKIEVECETLASGSDITFYSLDRNDTAVQMFTLTHATDGAVSYKEKFVNIKTSLFKLRATFAAGNTKGIHKITVWYEDAE